MIINNIMIFITSLIIFLSLIILYPFILKWINDQLLFHPTKLLKNYDLGEIKENYGKFIRCEIKEFFIKSGSENIHILYFINQNSKDLVIYSHGNAGNIIEYNNQINILFEFGSVILYDYRGYGKSSGSPSEEGIYEDSFNVWKFCIKNLKYNGKNIILWGMSLGCCVALWLGQRLVNNDKEYPKLIISQSGFYSLEKISLVISKFAPYFLSYEFDNDRYIKNIDGRIAIILLHSKNDEMIDYRHSKNLLKNKKNCYFSYIKGEHNTNRLSKRSLQLIRTILLNK